MGKPGFWWRMRQVPLKDLLTPKKWASFVFGTVLRVLVPLHFAEMVVYRSVQCKPCVDAGYCDKCYCTMPDKAYAPWEQCGDKHFPKWGPVGVLPTRKRWEAYKALVGLEFHVTEKQQQ